jgi:heat shock protein HslJ
MKHYKFLVILFPMALALVSGCSQQPIVKESGGLTENVLNNTAYHIGELGTVRLNNGEFKNQYGEGATQMHRVTLEKIASGDLNGDGVDDAAVILAWQNGGSGTFKYLVAVQNSSGLPQQIDSIILGGRVQVSALSITSGAVALEELTHAPLDPRCCPSRQVKQSYVLRANKWAQHTGKAVHSNAAKGAAEMLDPDITGIIWKLERFNDKEDSRNIVIDNPDKYTLTLLPNGAYQVKADCNRMQGQYTLEGKRIKIVPGPATLAECPPGSPYAEYLRRLNKAVSFILHENKLVLNLIMDEGNMIFKNGGSIHDSGHH